MKRASLYAAVLLAATTGQSSAAPRDDLRSRLPAFGRSVAIAGDLAFIGEPVGGGKPGTVHIYRRTPATGRWTAAGTLNAATPSANDGFGTGVATDGRTLLVTASADSTRGGVHVFTRGTDGKWTAAGRLGPASPEARSQFGQSLALAGDLAFVGQPGPSASAAGQVLVFRRGANGSWVGSGAMPAQALANGDGFGAALAASGDRVAVGAPGRNGGKGEVLIFRRGADGTWTQEAAVKGNRAPDNARIGTTVALRGDQLAAGAPAANTTVGMVATFERDAKSGNWVERNTFTPFELMPGTRFGTAIALGDREMWVGASGADRAGRIYQLHRNAQGNWTSMNKLAIDTLAVGAQFGGAFALGDGFAVVGMPGDAGGSGTVAFLGRTPQGAWTGRGTVFPAVADKWAAISGAEVRCDEGMAKEWECSNTGILSYMPISAIGGKRGTILSGNWGWTDPETGKDYALIGRNDGTSFIDVTDPSRPRYLGDLPKPATANVAIWKEMKTLGHYALIVSDGAGQHGIQIFDLHHLRNVKTPQTFKADAMYDQLASIHDIITNDDSKFAYAVGSNGGGEGCGGGYHMIDMRDPLNPVFAGCFADTKTGRIGTGYSHDGICRTYRGPDARYTGKEICVGSNETALSISDVSDKKNPVILGRGNYPDVGYTHQGWWTEDMRYFYVNDELDEVSGKGDAAKATRTLIFDMAKLDDPVFVGPFLGTTKASDHNLYVKGNRMYQSNYMAGLRIIDITDPVVPREVGFFDVAPGANTPGFSGSWNNYPFFKNGAILVNNMETGIFLIRDRTQAIP